MDFYWRAIIATRYIRLRTFIRITGPVAGRGYGSVFAKADIWLNTSTLLATSPCADGWKK